jgi:hypothetical protein
MCTEMIIIVVITNFSTVHELEIGSSWTQPYYRAVSRVPQVWTCKSLHFLDFGTFIILFTLKNPANHATLFFEIKPTQPTTFGVVILGRI